MMALFSVLLLVASVQVAIGKPYDLVVTDVGSNSAIIHWKTTEMSTAIEKFRILCNGTRHYVSVDGEHSLDIDDKLQYAPSGAENVRIGDLQENFNYSCTIQEGISSQVPILYGELSDPCNFSTEYGDPEQPVTPEIQVSQRRRSIKIVLFPTSTRFGPISGYQVQFHLVKSKTPDGLALIDDDAYDPHLPSSRLVSKSEAQLSIEAKSLWLNFENGTLPVSIVIGQKLLHGALKNGREYTVATVPYTVYKKQNESVLLYAPSNLSAIFKTWSPSSNVALLDTSDPAELALIIALGVGLPLLLLGYLACFGVAMYCIIRRRRKKRMRKEYSRRDVIQALALRRAQQLGIELPWYNHRTTDENQGDLPWLDPFSAAQPRLLSHISSPSSQSGLESHGDGTDAQPPDPGSPPVPDDALLTDAMAPQVFSGETNLTRQDVRSTAHAQQQSVATSLVASVLTKAILVVSNIKERESAGRDISTSNDAESTECAQHDDQSDCENLSPHPFVNEAAERMSKPDNHDLAMHTALSTDGSHNSFCSLTSSSSGDYHFLCSQDSAQSLIGSDHLSLHQVTSTEECVYSSSKCDDCDLGEGESMPVEPLLEGEESFYSSKSSNSEEQSVSEVRDNRRVQSVDCEELKVDTSKASQIDDPSSSDGCQNSLQSIASEHLSLHQAVSDTQRVHTAPVSSNCDDRDLSENKSQHGEVSLAANESLYCSKSIDSVEESLSDIHQLEDSAVQSASHSAVSVDQYDDKSTSELGTERLQEGDASQEPDHSISDNGLPPPGLEDASLEVNSSRISTIEDQPSSEFRQDTFRSIACVPHLSLHQTSAAQCTAPKSSNCDGCDLSESGEASLEVENGSLYSTKLHNDGEGSSSDIHQLEGNTVQSASREQPSVASVPQYANDIIDDSGKESDCSLGENKPPLKEVSLLEVEESFYSSKSSNSEEQGASVIHVNNTVQPTNNYCKIKLSVVSANQCTRSNDGDDHSTDDSGVEQPLPGDTLLELHHSMPVDRSDKEHMPPLVLEVVSSEENRSRMSGLIDDDSSSDYFQGSIQSMDDHLSLHQVASSAQCVRTVSFSTQSSSEEESSSYVSQESTSHENLSSHSVASTASRISDESSRLGGRTRTACDVDEIIAASLEFKQMVYDSRSSICRIRHIFTDYNLAEYKPLPEDSSLEVNPSSHGIKTSRTDCSQHRENSTPSQASSPSICSEPRMSNTDNHSSSDCCLYITRSTAYERLSLHQDLVELAAKCTHNNSRSSSCNDYSASNTDENIQRSAAALELTMDQLARSLESNTSHTDHDQNVIDKPLPSSTSKASIHSTKTSFSDDGTSSALPQDNHQAALDGEELSLHQLVSADQFTQSSSKPSSSHEGEITTDGIHVEAEKPLASDALLVQVSSSGFHPDNIQTDDDEHVSSLQLGSADQTMQSSSLKSLKSVNSTSRSTEDLCILMEDTDYFTALSSQCSSEQAGNGNNCTTTSHLMMLPDQHDYCVAEVGILMEPCVQSGYRLSSCDDCSVCNNVDEGIQPSAAALELTMNQSAYSNVDQSNHSVDQSGDDSLSLEVDCFFDATSNNGDHATQLDFHPESIHTADGEHQSPCQLTLTGHSSNSNDCKSLLGDSLLELNSEKCDDNKMSPPRDASPQAQSSDSDNGNFHQDSVLTVGSEHQDLHQVSSSEQSFFSSGSGEARINAANCSLSDHRQHCSDPLGSCYEDPSLRQVEATVHDQRLPRLSDCQLSPVGSVVSTKDETCITMELDNVELPHSYDKESEPEAAISNHSSSHLTVVDSSTEYYTALSGFSSSGHDSGHQVSPVGSVLSTEDEVRIIMEPENSPSNVLKMSSSTSLFIPRGLSNGPWNSSSSLASFQRNDSTTTFHSVLMQLSGSSASEEDKEQRSNHQSQLPPPIYEPY